MLFEPLCCTVVNPIHWKVDAALPGDPRRSATIPKIAETSVPGIRVRAQWRGRTHNERAWTVSRCPVIAGRFMLRGFIDAAQPRGCMRKPLPRAPRAHPRGPVRIRQACARRRRSADAPELTFQPTKSWYGRADFQFGPPRNQEYSVL